MGSKISLEEKEKKIGIAVEFLQNEKIKNESQQMKVSFLSQKGLDDDMILEAFDRYTNLLIKNEVQKCLEDEQDTNKIIDINYLIERSFKTKFLSLRNINMKTITEDFVNKIKHVNVLILNNNPIKKLPNNINIIKDLKVLQLINCQLDDNSFPENFYKLQNIENLNLSNNNLKEYKKFDKLKKLQILIIKNNEIINYQDFDNNHIKKIFLNGNPININDFKNKKDLYFTDQQLILIYIIKLMTNWVQKFQVSEFDLIKDNDNEYFLVVSKILEKPKSILNIILQHFEYIKKQILYLKKFFKKLRQK